MQTNNRVSVISILGAIVVVLSIGMFFLLDFEKIALYFWALTFLLISEIVLCLGLIGLSLFRNRFNKLFIKSGILSALFLYFFATLISIMFAWHFNGKLMSFILLEFVIMMLFVLIVIAVLLFGRTISNVDSKIVSERMFMDYCEKRLYALLCNHKYKAYEHNINTLYESIKYSDKIGLSSVDQNIDNKITELEKKLSGVGESNNNVLTICNEIIMYINCRKAEISESKRGGF